MVSLMLANFMVFSFFLFIFRASNLMPFCYNDNEASNMIRMVLDSQKISDNSHAKNHTKVAPHENPNYSTHVQERTQLKHIVFGIGASSKLWDRRKEYIKIWWRPEEMRGFAWLDQPVDEEDYDRRSLPEVKISGDTSEFPYKHASGARSGLRISRIVSEIVRLGLDDVRWIVMGDDDTFFVADNLVRVLSKYDHTKFYYIGSTTESHTQNLHFSYHMAYGGGGFAISYPLAKELEKMQDRCIHRYPTMYGSDDRMHACMSELGVPLTKEVGFHQMDIFGNPMGLLSAHPVAPLVSLHHLDVMNPIFPNVDQAHALKRLTMPMRLDSAALMQQSICYDKARNWTISNSWGYTAHIYRGLIRAIDMEMPTRTFLDWYRGGDGRGLIFNTRHPGRNSCERPSVFVLSNAVFNSATNRTASEYVVSNSETKCGWKMDYDPSTLYRVEVHKKPDPNLWDKPPRRNCCTVLSTKKEGTVAIDVHECAEGETIEI
ncbi:uncharacterized protein [Henckelia pumila]|uniref:uncharacterized protein n=1 Tax=Henckelia pumila TaxID=405737 RepID=UPI003C6E1AEA